MYVTLLVLLLAMAAALVVHGVVLLAQGHPVVAARVDMPEQAATANLVIVGAVLPLVLAAAQQGLRGLLVGAALVF
jgi:hypothetical protein